MNKIATTDTGGRQQRLAGLRPLTEPAGAWIQKLCRSLAIAWLCLAWLPHAPGAEDTSLEYKVKAGFLYNFAKFVEWPSNSLPASNSPIVIGVFADDPAAPVLKQALDGKMVNGRSLIVKSLSETAALSTCHIFFLSRARQDRLKDVLGQVNAAPILTVGEMDQFAQRGGVINFVRADDSFRFEVNLEVAEKAGLKISAKLANMATIVKTRK
ncbi:MAG: YfiR family protein [Pedosphaera sp.]|nr:YfiR family protein [Pedosphaera sp.]